MASKRHLYRLIDPRNTETFYIGQTNDPVHRLKTHCKTFNPRNKNQVRIKSILDSGGFPVMDVFFTAYGNYSVRSFEKLEKEVIRKFLDAGYKLENTSL